MLARERNHRQFRVIIRLRLIYRSQLCRNTQLHLFKIAKFGANVWTNKLHGLSQCAIYHAHTHVNCLFASLLTLASILPHSVSFFFFFCLFQQVASGFLNLSLSLLRDCRLHLDQYENSANFLNYVRSFLAFFIVFFNVMISAFDPTTILPTTYATIENYDLGN